MQIDSMRSPCSDAIRIDRHPDGRGSRLQAVQYLPQPRDRVFDFFTDAFQLESLTPPWLRFSVLTPAPIRMAVGTLIDYRLRLHGVPIRWRSRISVWEPPLRFVDEQVRGPYRRWHHEHTFESAGGGTLCRDVVDYDVPGGRLIDALFVRRDLLKIFAYRQERLGDRFAGGRDGGRLLFDFDDAAAAKQWRTVNDGVMGGRSEGRFRITPDRTLEFSGAISLENNGGFASVRSISRPLGLSLDDTLVVRVRGDGRPYLLNLYAPDRPTAFSHRAPVPTIRDRWTEIAVPLKDFAATSFGRRIPNAPPVDAASIDALGFMLSDKTPGPFRIEIASIQAVGHRPGDSAR